MKPMNQLKYLSTILCIALFHIVTYSTGTDGSAGELSH